MSLKLQIPSLALFLTLLLTSVSNSVQAESVLLDVGQDLVEVGPFLNYYLDSEGNMGLEQVMHHDFSSVPNGIANFGFTTDKIWLRFDVHNTSEFTLKRMLRTSARFMRPLEIYLQRENSSIEHLLYNDETQRFHDRPLPELRYLAAEFELEPQETATIWIRFGAGGQASMTLQISDRESALSEQYQSTTAIVLFIAVLGTLILVNFFHYIALGQVAYLVYVFYESFNVIYVSHMEGFTWQYLWPNLPWFNADATPIIAASGLIIGNLFALVFLETWKYTPKLHNLLLGLIGCSAIIFVCTLFADNSFGNQLTAPMLPVSLLINVVIAIYSLRAGHYLARYFCVAWLLFAVLGIIWSGSILGFLSPSYNLLSLYKIIIAAQALILSMGLADQVRRLNNQFTETQKSLISSLQGRLDDAKERLRLEKQNENTMLQLLQKSKLLAATSHDINQPVQSLRLAIESLKRTSPDEETTQQLGRTLDHMEAVLGSALDDASEDLKKNSDSSTIQSVVVGSIISEVANQFDSQAEARGIGLRAHRGESVIVSRIVPLKRCLMNLVSNAIKATTRGGVLIGSRRRGNNMVFQVIDTGEGIAEEDQDEMLKPLVSGNESAGHGLGLAIVAETCAQYGWELDIKSRVGCGSCFSLTVPIRIQ